jgi:MFS-type transporter involved in bile tolerance (Atg22 family)
MPRFLKRGSLFREIPMMNRKHIVSWALYDFANSIYPAVVTTAVFGAYYASKIIGDERG